MTKHDLIAQVGGYESARKLLRDQSGMDPEVSINSEMVLVDIVDDALLKYRTERGFFEVGDLVVFDTTKPFCSKLPNDLMEYQQVSPSSKHDAIVWVGERMFEVGGKSIRHATPQEIKTGHRIELSGNTGQLEVLDMIHVSPSCEVIDYE